MKKRKALKHNSPEALWLVKDKYTNALVCRHCIKLNDLKRNGFKVLKKGLLTKSDKKMFGDRHRLNPEWLRLSPTSNTPFYHPNAVKPLLP